MGRRNAPPKVELSSPRLSLYHDPLFPSFPAYSLFCIFLDSLIPSVLTLVPSLPPGFSTNTVLVSLRVCTAFSTHWCHLWCSSAFFRASFALASPILTRFTFNRSLSVNHPSSSVTHRTIAWVCLWGPRTHEPQPCSPIYKLSNLGAVPQWPISVWTLDPSLALSSNASSLSFPDLSLPRNSFRNFMLVPLI